MAHRKRHVKIGFQKCHCHDETAHTDLASVAAETITLKEVLGRLRTIYKVSTDEDLARLLEMNLRTFARHKSGEPDYFQRVVTLLDRAQLLKREPVDPSEVHPDRIHHAVTQLAENLEELSSLLGPPQA